MSCILFLLYGVFSASEIYAADTLTQFNTTIQKLEISKDGGSTFFTIFDGVSRSVDLVALSGQNVGTFLGEADVPEGHYNFYRVIVTAATLVYRVDGTGATNATNLSSSNTGTLTVDLTTYGGFPRTETGTMSTKCNAGGTTNAVINFDAATSSSNLQYADNDGPGAGTTVTFQGVTFAPVISVVE